MSPLPFELGPRGGIQPDHVRGALTVVAGVVLFGTFGYFASTWASRGRSRASRFLRRSAAAAAMVVAAFLTHPW